MITENFQDLLKYVRNNRVASIETLTIDLSVARNNFELNTSGLVLYVEDATDLSASLQIRHNEIESGLITLVKNYGVVYPFYRIFLTNAAQASKTITLTVGRAAPFEIIDNRSAVNQTTVLEDILAQLEGAATPETWGSDITVGTSAVSLLASNADRKSAIIQADLANTGIIYIGFDNTVGSSKKVVALLPGGVYSVDDYLGQIYGISGVAGQKVSASEV